MWENVVCVILFAYDRRHIRKLTRAGEGRFSRAWGDSILLAERSKNLSAMIFVWARVDCFFFFSSYLWILLVTHIYSHKNCYIQVLQAKTRVKAHKIAALLLFVALTHFAMQIFAKIWFYEQATPSSPSWINIIKYSMQIHLSCARGIMLH